MVRAYTLDLIQETPAARGIMDSPTETARTVLAMVAMSDFSSLCAMADSTMRWLAARMRSGCALISAYDSRERHRMSACSPLSV